MATLIALTVIILAIVYFRWLLKMCDKDDEQREKAKNKIVNARKKEKRYRYRECIVK